MNRPLTCEEIDSLAREAARALRGEPVESLDEDLRQRVLAHTHGCASCTARLDREHRLDVQLAGWGDAESPPPALERRLLRVYRERFSTAALTTPELRPTDSAPPSPPSAGERVGVRGSPLLPDPRYLPINPPEQRDGRSSRTHRTWPAIAVAALGAAAAAILFLVRLTEREATVAVVTRPVPAPAPIEERAALPITGGPREMRPVARFVPLGWDGETRPIEIGRITRVRMPTSVAAHFGWPLLPDAPEARVAADVLVGEDGTARALRFLPASFTPVSNRTE